MKQYINYRRFLSIIILIILSISGFSQIQSTALQDKISGIQKTKGFEHAAIGISISDIQSGKSIFQTEPQLSLVPASIFKVVTTTTALEVFGPDFQFQTTLAYSGTIKNDTLWGDLQIVGGGDPTLGSEYFPEGKLFLDDWTKAIQEKGIKVIAGNLILDATIYENQTIPSTWIWEDLGNYFGAGASGISVFDNQYEIHLKSENSAGLHTKIVGIVPEIPGLDLKNEVLSSDQNRDLSFVFGSPLDSRRIIRGTIPKNKSDFIVKASVPDPAALLENEFRKKLSAENIFISGETKYEKANNGNELTNTKSPALSEIIRITNHESVNLFAEHLLKQLAVKAFGLGTTDEGCKLVHQFWEEKGLDLDGFFVSDGSGLSRFNAITARQMVEILNYMANESRWSEEFSKSLPTVGNGTIRSFNVSNFPNKSLRAKSGSMTRVRCYAGYLNSISGKQFSFTIMLNNFSCSQAEAGRKIEEILVELRKI